jgi:mannitol-1-phosphate/altronate dehydrogenase
MVCDAFQSAVGSNSCPSNDSYIGLHFGASNIFRVHTSTLPGPLIASSDNSATRSVTTTSLARPGT